MIKLLSIISIILAIILFSPAVLAVLSNNAVPGDSTYPIKRSLEDGIYAIASLNPTSKAWFSAARSDRRYKEVSALITQGKVAKDTLSELVSQTDTAAIQIAQIQDPVQKQQLVAQYTQTIEKYNQGLGELAQTQVNTPPQQIATKPETADSPQSFPISQPPTPQPTTVSKITPKPSQHSTLPTPTSTPVATSTPVPTPTPSVIPSVTPTPTSPPPQSVSNLDKQDIQDTIEKLGKIKDKLKHQENDNQKESKGSQNEKQNQKEVIDTPKSVKSIKETK